MHMMFPDTQYDMTMTAARTVGAAILGAGLLVAAAVVAVSRKSRR